MKELKVVGIRKSYIAGERVINVLENISFTVKRGESVVFMGPSGCGKSTLIRIIAGLEKPDEGYILLDGKKITKPTREIMVIFQNYLLIPWKTVLENVELALLHLPKEERRKKALEALDLVGLDGFEENFPDDLSGGMKQRVGIARAIARESSVLLLDEPFSNLDPFSASNLRSEVMKFFRNENQNPNALVVVTHSVEEAVFMGDRVFLLSYRPAKIIKEIRINLHPLFRSPRDEKFQEYVELISSILSEF